MKSGSVPPTVAIEAVSSSPGKIHMASHATKVTKNLSIIQKVLIYVAIGIAVVAGIKLASRVEGVVIEKEASIPVLKDSNVLQGPPAVEWKSVALREVDFKHSSFKVRNGDPLQLWLAEHY